MSNTVKIGIDEKCAEIVYTYILNEFSCNLKMLEDVIATIVSVSYTHLTLPTILLV